MPQTAAQSRGSQVATEDCAVAVPDPRPSTMQPVHTCPLHTCPLYSGDTRLQLGAAGAPVSQWGVLVPGVKPDT